MTRPTTSALPQRLLLGAGLALAAAAAQAAGSFTLPVGTCAPASLLTLQMDLKLTNGAVRRAGRNPPGGSRYMCDVPDDFAAAEAPNTFQLGYIDKNTSGEGNVSARLMRRTRTTGATKMVARLDSVPSATLKMLSVTLTAPLDTVNYTYFIFVDMKALGQPVEAHTVGLTKH